MVSFRPTTGEIPTDPGVYRFRDAARRVIYVGKASNLRSRLTSYFADALTLHPRTQAMLTDAVEVDWVVVRTEVEALSLEYSWIKEYEPRFNVKYRDDKTYPYLAVSISQEYPRVSVVREPKRAGTKYFGPYAHAWAIRETVDELLRVFPMRSCRDGVFRQAQSQERPCLLAHIGKCSAPCVGWISVEAHRGLADGLCAVMQGHGSRYLADLELRMRQHADAEEFELAARDRDRLGALHRVLERNAVVLPAGTDVDVVALAEGALEAGVQMFRVRNGRVTGELGFVLEKSEDLTTHGYVERALQRIYDPGDESHGKVDWAPDDEGHLPRQVLVNYLPTGVGAWEQWLSDRRGSIVTIRVPERGDKRSLLNTAATNAEQILLRHSLRRSNDLTTRSQAIEELQRALGLEQPPLRIECIDISNTQGEDCMASLVVFEDGLARKKDYRSYAVTSVMSNDPAAIAEIVTRRFRHLGAGTRNALDGPDPRAPDDSEPGQSSAYPPGLILVDGGPAQVAAASDALTRLGVRDVPIAGLAKRLEELWLPDQVDPVVLPRGSEALYLVQRIRDEAHRVAITLHRKRRGRRMSNSVLDSIPGLGPKRAQALLREFGSVRRIKAASTQDLSGVPGIGTALANVIHQHLREV